ncbi:MAG: anti-sigma factor family protein [Planctomycetota bacterium]|jgi:hypothetical protein
MKENLNIDELLNSFLDDELTQRQRTEVNRLVRNDEEIARRLKELERCKMLVSSLPTAEAPAEMIENIKESLERRTLLDHYNGAPDEHKGARQLFYRKLVAVAAVIALVSVLGSLVYTIIVPKGTANKALAIEDWQLMKPETDILRPESDFAQSDSVVMVADGLTDKKFQGRLELKTDNSVAVNSAINRAIKDNDLQQKESPEDIEAGNLYVLSGTSEKVRLFIADLTNVWPELDGATLWVEEEEGKQVVVDWVGPGQIEKILSQKNLKGSIELAKEFSNSNSSADFSSFRTIFAKGEKMDSELVFIPKPVLTGGEENKTQKTVEETEEIRLTIVVSGTD